MEPLTKVLSHLKIRGSIGRLGNQSGAALYTFASTMSLSGGLGGYYFADGRHMYLNAPGVVNPATTWEKVNSRNIGLDFALFNNSLTGSFDIFQRTTKDMLGLGTGTELPWKDRPASGLSGRFLSLGCYCRGY